jgi:uncharacterized protein (TIGR04255 family)
MAGLPISLEHDTIEECVVEARLSDSHPSAPDLLPGMVFSRIPDLFKRAAPLPLGQVPRQLRDQNPQLFFAPTQALEGDKVRMLFGPHVVAVSFAKPYAGWKVVQPCVLRCLNMVFDTKLAGRPQRFSIKYINLLQHGRDQFDLSQTKMRLQLGAFDLAEEGTFVRTEIKRNGCTSVVEIASGAKIVQPPSTDQATGVLLTVDTSIKAPESDFRSELEQLLNTLHTTEKEIFFGLLSAETLQKLGPRYETTH